MQICFMFTFLHYFFIAHHWWFYHYDAAERELNFKQHGLNGERPRFHIGLAKVFNIKMFLNRIEQLYTASYILAGDTCLLNYFTTMLHVPDFHFILVIK